MSNMTCRKVVSIAVFVVGALLSSFTAAADYARIEENDPSITYIGDWQVHTGDRLSGGSLVAGGAGASAIITFSGTGIAWYEYFSSQVRGGAKIYLDGQLVGSSPSRDGVVDVYGEKQLRYAVGGLPNTTHTLRVEGTGGVLGDVITIDAFVVQTGRGGVDTTPPEIVIRAPREGTRVSGWVSLIADAFDNDGNRVMVRWYVDDTEIYVDATKPVTRLNLLYWWVTSGTNSSGDEVEPVSNGPHVLTAVARDAAGNETRSAPVNLIVDHTPPPTVTMTGPAAGAQVSGVVTLSADVTGSIAPGGVRFYAQGSDGIVHLLGQDASAPYAITRDTSSVPSGSRFQLWAGVEDLYGNVRWSSPAIGVTVQH